MAVSSPIWTARSSSAMACSRVEPGQRGHRVGLAARRPCDEGVDVDGAAEQVQHGELGAFGFGEGVGEAVVQRRGQRCRSAQRRVLVRSPGRCGLGRAG